MKKRNSLFFLFSLILCFGGWIAVIFFEIKIGYTFSSVGLIGIAYIQYKDWKNQK